MLSGKKPFVSVIIPSRIISSSKHDELLLALDNQTYEWFETLIITDHTRHSEKLFKRFSWLSIIPTKKRLSPAEKRNYGAKRAVGEIFAFIDDDAFPTTRWLEFAVEIIRKKNICAVCGPGLLPRSASFWERVFDEVMKSRFGSGGFSYRFIKGKARLVDDYPSMNFIIRRTMFERVDGFKTKYWPGEDSKLCEDLVYEESQDILYHPEVAVFHHRRNNVYDYLQQHARYGFRRGAFFVDGDKNSRKVIYLLPTLAVLYLLSLPFLFTRMRVFQSVPWVWVSVLIPLIVYLCIGLLVFLSSLRRSRSLKIAASVWIMVYMTHIVYGVMFFLGVVIKVIDKLKN